jgi:hypothetical protein
MRRSSVAVAVLAVATTVAGCGGSTSPASTTTVTTTAATTTAAPAEAATAWVDKVCGEIADLVSVQTQMPDVQGKDQAQTLKAVDSYFASAVTAVDQTISDLRAVGPSPVAGGGDGVNALIRGLESLRNGYQNTRTKLATIDTSSPQAAQAAMVDAVSSITQGAQELGTAMQSVERNPALQEAGKKAPNCQKLEGSDSATSTSATPTSATPTS